MFLCFFIFSSQIFFNTHNKIIHPLLISLSTTRIVIVRIRNYEHIYPQRILVTSLHGRYWLDTDLYGAAVQQINSSHHRRTPATTTTSTTGTIKSTNIGRMCVRASPYARSLVCAACKRCARINLFACAFWTELVWTTICFRFFAGGSWNIMRQKYARHSSRMLWHFGCVSRFDGR